ncbi:hypothetical protein [Granulicoccus phenolivorans]|uniref:hypothetical protein n=1 Tax=Granulicoccus phenolivorans TaxID=266854 RepID=UPI000412985A|nr:hypothetical protein [Granulicoccus phenolivorans]
MSAFLVTLAAGHEIVNPLPIPNWGFFVIALLGLLIALGITRAAGHSRPRN